MITSRSARSAIVNIGARILTVNQSGMAGVRFDFDGDGKIDLSVYRNGIRYILQTTNSQCFAFQFGLAGDKPAQIAGKEKDNHNDCLKIIEKLRISFDSEKEFWFCGLLSIF